MYTMIAILLIGSVIIGRKYREWIDSHLAWFKPYAVLLVIIILFGSIVTIFNT